MSTCPSTAGTLPPLSMLKYQTASNSLYVQCIIHMGMEKAMNSLVPRPFHWLPFYSRSPGSGKDCTQNRCMGPCLTQTNQAICGQMDKISVSENGERAGWHRRNKCARAAIAVHISTSSQWIEQMVLTIIDCLKVPHRINRAQPFETINVLCLVRPHSCEQGSPSVQIRKKLCANV